MATAPLGYFAGNPTTARACHRADTAAIRMSCHAIVVGDRFGFGGIGVAVFVEKF